MSILLNFLDVLLNLLTARKTPYSNPYSHQIFTDIAFNAVITIAIQLRYDYDVSRAPASIRREQKMNMSICRRSGVVVVSQSNRMQIVISITSVVVECVMVSSYRSRIAIVI